MEFAASISIAISMENCKFQNSLLVELSPNYDNEKFPKIVLPNSRHVSSIKQERVHGKLYTHQKGFDLGSHCAALCDLTKQQKGSD